MAMATCVFTCSSWFSMSRMTCLIIFSGCSALSIRSLRFARTKVETRSSNAMMDSFLFRSKLLVVLMRIFARHGRADGDSAGEPEASRAEDYRDSGSDACSEGDAQADLHGWSLHVSSFIVPSMDR